MAGCQDKVIETVAMPDLIQAGDSGELLAVRLYDKTNLGRKHVVLAYRETNATDGFYIDGVSHPSPISTKGGFMDTLKILQATDRANWDYDDEADVLYLSVGDPRQAVGVDIGDGVVLRYDEETQEVVGLTVIGLRAKLAKAA